MAKTLNLSGDSFKLLMAKLNTYFSRLNTSEVVAYGAIFLGIILVIIGLMML